MTRRGKMGREQWDSYVANILLPIPRGWLVKNDSLGWGYRDAGRGVALPQRGCVWCIGVRSVESRLLLNPQKAGADPGEKKS